MDEENNGNSLGTKLKDKINSAIKKITKIITKFLLVKALPIVIIIILLAGAWYVITGGVVDKIKEVFTGTVGGDILHNINIDMIDNDERVYVIQDDYSEEIKAALKEIDVDYTTIGLGEDLNIIKKFYEAEIVTSCPDLRLRDEIGTEVEDGNLQGIIQFKRKYSDSTEELLEYKDFTSFQTELAKFGYDLQDAEGNSSTQEQIYFTRSDVESNYEELKRYFTLDSEMNLIIATINSTYIDNRYSDYAKKEGNQDSQDYSFYIGIKKVNYRTVTDKYSMPMEFLLYMLMISQSPEFCEEIVELVKDSKIVIEIQDNITTTTTTESYDYRADFILTGSARVYIHVDKTKYPYYGGANYTYVNISKDPKEEIAKKQKDIVNHPYSVKKTIEKNNNVSLYVTEAKTWIMDYEATYSNMQEEETSRDQITQPDDNYIGVADFHGYLNAYLTDKTDLLGKDAIKGVAIDQFDIVSTSGNITERKTGKQTIIETQVVSNRYVINSTVVEGKEEKFLSLLKVNPTTGVFDKQNRNNNTEYKKYKNTEGIEESPEGNILSAADALFYFLSSNESTQSYESIMRYLLYIYTGTNYGTTTFDFSIYETGSFISISGGSIVGNSIQEKVWFALKNLGYSDYAISGAMGNIDYESGGFSTSAVEGGSGTGIGLLQWSFGRRTQLETYAASKGVSWQDEDTQVEFLIAEISGQGPASAYATHRTAGYIKEEGAAYTAYHSDWANATTINNATLAFMRFFESPLSASSYDERCRRAQNYYNEFQGKTAASTTQELIVAWAEQQVGHSEFYNSYSGQLRESKGRCAAFAKSAHYEAGLEYLPGNAIDIPHPNAIQYDASGKVDCSNIPIGAFIVSSGTSAYGHVALYVGDGYVIEAGGKTIVKQKIDSSYGRGKFLGWGY